MTLKVRKDKIILFSLGNIYEIPLKEKKIVIIYGTNGSGKTRLLQSITKNIEKSFYFECNDSMLVSDIEPFLNGINDEKEKVFLSILNDSYLCNKEIISLNPFRFRFTKSESEFVGNFNQLSDGEKNMVIIFAIAIFSEYKIICFDNIEFSLHLSLQSRIINDLITNTNKLYFIATHSPSVVSDHMKEAHSINDLMINIKVEAIDLEREVC